VAGLPLFTPCGKPAGADDGAAPLFSAASGGVPRTGAATFSGVAAGAGVSFDTTPGPLFAEGPETTTLGWSFLATVPVLPGEAGAEGFFLTTITLRRSPDSLAPAGATASGPTGDPFPSPDSA